MVPLFDHSKELAAFTHAQFGGSGKRRGGQRERHFDVVSTNRRSAGHTLDSDHPKYVGFYSNRFDYGNVESNAPYQSAMIDSYMAFATRILAISQCSSV